MTTPTLPARALPPADAPPAASRPAPTDRTPLVASSVGGRSWAYVGAGLGAVVSIAANIAHSFVPPAGADPEWRPQPGAIALAAFWPSALLLAIEVLARVPWPPARRWTVLRFGGVVPVAAVAAVVSYRHLSGLLHFYGEDPLTVAIGPAAVDGLMLVATSALLATLRLIPVHERSHYRANDDHPDEAVAPARAATTQAGAASEGSSRTVPSSSSSRRPTLPSKSARSDRSHSSSSRVADEAALRELVAQARAARHGAGEPAVRRLLAESGLSASAARVRAALTAAPTSASNAASGAAAGSVGRPVPAAVNGTTTPSTRPEH